jgi:hypothetical protein
MGVEFRYAAAPGSSGTVTASFVNEKPSETTYPDGTVLKRDAGRNYQVQGSLTQQLPGNFRAGAQVRYFTDLAVDALYHYNPYDATNRQSTISANVSGQWAGIQLGAAYQRSEYFYSSTSSAVTGALPRISVSRPEQTLFGLPVYWGFAAESNSIISQIVKGDSVVDNGRTRLNVTPTLRAPLSRLPWLNVTAGATWHTTWWSRSLNTSGVVVDEPISRRYFELQATATGPTFSRVFNTPGSRFAQRWKHVIEPAATINRTTAIAVRGRVLSDYDSTDLAVGGVTRLNYSLTNRLYIKRGEGTAGQVREIFSVTFSQGYYPSPALAAEDQLARNPALLYLPQSSFTPLQVTARLTPADAVSVDFRTEYEPVTNTFRQLSAGGTIRIATYADINAAWSKTRQPKDSPFATSDYYNAESLNAGTTWRDSVNSKGISYRVNYDIRNTAFINQGVTAYYNPQCCGIAIEYFRANLPAIGGVQGRVYDRRFNVMFTLAGIGTFSDFFGALGADPYRR